MNSTQKFFNAVANQNRSCKSGFKVHDEKVIFNV